MNPIRRLLIFCALLTLPLLWPSVSRAQSQAEMNRQAEKDFVTEDAKLNQIYQRLIGKLDAEALEKLKAAQRAWVAFRDAQAALEADLDARDGSMAPLIYNGTRATLTKSRVKDLETLLKDNG